MISVRANVFREKEADTTRHKPPVCQPEEGCVCVCVCACVLERSYGAAMTRAALTKLLILVILAFIICLPEFFTLYKASKVNFICLPSRPCERGNQMKTGENGKIRDAEIRRKDICDPSKTAELEKQEHACTQENQSKTTDPTSESRRHDEDPENSWFVCETDVDITELHRNNSSLALKVHFEVSVELQLRDAETLNFTLYGHNNDNFLRLRPPEEEEEEEEEEEQIKKTDDEGLRKAFYCCFPGPSTSESANQSRCLLWLSNQTILNATTNKESPLKRTPKDEWRCVFRVLWLALLCVVLLTIVTTVLGEIFWGKCLRKKTKVSVCYNFTDLQFGDGEEHKEIIIPKGIVINSSGTRYWSELSPIQEANSQDDIETLLDGNVEPCYTANLHHRNHPSASSLTEEQAW